MKINLEAETLKKHGSAEKSKMYDNRLLGSMQFSGRDENAFSKSYIFSSRINSISY